jgi:MFS family permease
VSEAAPARATALPGAAAGPTAGRARVELLIVSTGALLVSLSQSVLVPVLAILPERLHTSTSNVEWLLTSTLLVGAVAVPLFGRMGDLFGKRRLLIVALAALAAGVRRGGRVDIPGAVVMSGALGALLLPLAQGNSWGWASARTLGLLGGAVVLLGVFVALERPVSQPLVDLKATTRRPIVLTNLASLINANTPAAELAAANGLNSLARSLGSSLASAIGGSLLTVSTITIAGAVLPSLAAYRSLFAACAAVAVLAAGAALFVPHDPRPAEPEAVAE